MLNTVSNCTLVRSSDVLCNKMRNDIKERIQIKTGIDGELGLLLSVSAFYMFMMLFLHHRKVTKFTIAIFKILSVLNILTSIVTMIPNESTKGYLMFPFLFFLIADILKLHVSTIVSGIIVQSLGYGLVYMYTSLAFSEETVVSSDQYTLAECLGISTITLIFSTINSLYLDSVESAFGSGKNRFCTRIEKTMTHFWMLIIQFTTCSVLVYTAWADTIPYMKYFVLVNIGADILLMCEIFFRTKYLIDRDSTYFKVMVSFARHIADLNLFYYFYLMIK